MAASLMYPQMLQTSYSSNGKAQIDTQCLLHHDAFVAHVKPSDWGIRSQNPHSTKHQI